MTIITIDRIEKAINDCRKAHPPINYSLGPDLRKLATIWGGMIAGKQRAVDIDSLEPAQLAVLRQWLGAAAGVSPE